MEGAAMNSRNKKLTLFVFVALLVTTNAFTMDQKRKEWTTKQRAESSLQFFLEKNKKFHLFTRVRTYRDGSNDKTPQYYKPIIDKDKSIKEQGYSLLAQYRNLHHEFSKEKHDTFILNEKCLDLWKKFKSCKFGSEASNRVYTALTKEYQKTLSSSTACFPGVVVFSGRGGFAIFGGATQEHKAYDLFKSADMLKYKTGRRKALEELLSELRKLLENLEPVENVEQEDNAEPGLEDDAELDDGSKGDFPGCQNGFEFKHGDNADYTKKSKK